VTNVISNIRNAAVFMSVNVQITLHTRCIWSLWYISVRNFSWLISYLYKTKSAILSNKCFLNKCSCYSEMPTLYYNRTLRKVVLISFPAHVFLHFSLWYNRLWDLHIHDIWKPYNGTVFKPSSVKIDVQVQKSKWRDIHSLSLMMSLTYFPLRIVSWLELYQ
jgi:hypothetical protein